MPPKAPKSPKSTKTSNQIGSNDLLQIYRTMLLTRAFDNKVLSLQRQGRLGAYISCTGEEASIVPSAYALKKDDWMFTSYREVGAHIVRGLSIELMFAQLFGNSTDLLKGRQMSNSWGSRDLNIVPTAAPIGAYLPVAVGLAMGANIKKKDLAVLAYMGDGGTSASDFHAAMNFAGVFRAPIVFICRNNGWAISLPVSRQSASKTLAIKARAYGFEGIRVDGNDAVAVYEATRVALEKARSGGGPTFIEALTYRIGAHSTADDPSKYRDPKETEVWAQKDPIAIMKKYLAGRKILDDKTDKSLLLEVSDIVSKAAKAQEEIPLLQPEKLIFDDVFAELPPFLLEQRDELLLSKW
ncbi:MAG TPA: thiamine pyrophosphate-dependent dehydrogenase E1 component subunit alpha [Nitrososphaerales archaeon]|nr:thiamine pyrophosphate-dependent dehydrogenase E1 component subunit alpha [Nitrososphaerales archaeon]